MYARFVAALCTGAFLVPAAEAAISVNYLVMNQQPLICSAAENVRLTPAASISGVRFSFECASDGIRRGCQPAPYTGDTDGDLMPNAPNIKYVPNGSGATITVVCDTSPSAAPLSIKGTEVVGAAGATDIVGCHPATNVSFEPSVPVESCVTGAGAGAASCLRYRCPSESTSRSCFPVAQLSYVGSLPESEPALRRVSVICELSPPLLSSDFDG